MVRKLSGPTRRPTTGGASKVKKIDVPLSGYSGRWTLPGYEVPDTDGTIAVHKQHGDWQLTHIQSGYGLFSLCINNRADGVKAAQCFYRACQRIGIDLHRKRKRFNLQQEKYLRKACAKWMRTMTVVN